MRLKWRFNAEVFKTKTFQSSAIAYAGVWTAFAAGEADWKFLLGSTAAFIILTCARDGGITIVKEIKAIKDKDCPPLPKDVSHTISFNDEWGDNK